jgi:hypothetical protein
VGWLFPIILGVALGEMSNARKRGRGQHGVGWFSAWVGGGALFLFSFLTGLSIRPALVIVAAVHTLWLAWHAPYWREAFGFPLGGVLFYVGLALFA